MGDNGTTATDIITYIGVPLAVLGVLPILYNTIATLLALHRIRRMLARSGQAALTRSDVVNRVIEVELPRYAVAPWDRHRERARYWTLSRRASPLPGGSWTVFNWRTRPVGARVQRLEYADQLRQPQADAAFADLVAYLLDLGALPDPRGWKLLRAAGLWTPVGCALLTSPDGLHKALALAPPEDADGHLSLSVSWSPDWTTRDSSSLPPYWVRLPPPPPPPENSLRATDTVKSDEAPIHEAKEAPGDEQGERGSMTKKSVDSPGPEEQPDLRAPITCQISAEGITAAVTDTPSPSSIAIEHLSAPPGAGGSSSSSSSDIPAGTWFASAVTAYGTTGRTMLWSYRAPDAVLAFARRPTVPCGVLVLLGAVDEAATPEWAARHDRQRETFDLFVRRSTDQRLAVAAEAAMAPAQRELAARDRARREAETRMQDMRDQLRRDRERIENRKVEAMQSPKWSTKRVAEHELAWLQDGGHVPRGSTLQDAVGVLLHRMVLDGELTASICEVLDRWKAWADNGGMRRADLDALEEAPVVFAEATLLIAVIQDTSLALEGTLSMDLQECLRLWKDVRLG